MQIIVISLKSCSAKIFKYAMEICYCVLKGT